MRNCLTYQVNNVDSMEWYFSKIKRHVSASTYHTFINMISLKGNLHNMTKHGKGDDGDTDEEDDKDEMPALNPQFEW